MMNMRKQTSLVPYFFSLCLGMIALLISAPASAELTPHVYTTQVHVGSDGLAIQQPSISQTEILNTLTQAHRLLTAQGQKAKTVVTEHDTGNNIVVAAIMPGGLIYLAYQQNKLKNAQTTLANVENELESLDADAVTLYKPVYPPSHQPIVIARYP